MKQFLMIGAAALLAACTAPEKPDYWTATRTGYGAQTAAGAPAATADGPDYRTAALAEAGQYTSLMRPGLHKTSTGAPWQVYHSRSFQRQGKRLTGHQAAEAAMAYSSAKQKPPYAATVALGQSQARFRIVTLDGSSFAVLSRLRLPRTDLYAPEGEALNAIASRSAQISGCTVTGPAWIKRASGYAVELAAPVVCS